MHRLRSRTALALAGTLSLSLLVSSKRLQHLSGEPAPLEGRRADLGGPGRFLAFFRQMTPDTVTFDQTVITEHLYSWLESKIGGDAMGPIGCCPPGQSSQVSLYSTGSVKWIFSVPAARAVS